MKPIVDALASGLHGSPTDICHTLLVFQDSISAIVMSGPLPANFEDSLSTVWSTLFAYAAHSASSVRVTTYTTTSMFLLKIAPFHAAILRRTFSNVVSRCDLPSQSSVLIVASFAFLSNFVSPAHLEQFLQRTPIYHHFLSTEVISSEHLSTLVDNIANLNTDWFTSVLMGLLRANPENANRLVMKAITSIVKRSPTCLIECVIGQSPSLALLTYLFRAFPLAFAEIDILKFAQSAFDLLSNLDEKSISEIDDALVVLSIPSRSFEVKISRGDDLAVEIELVGHGKLVFGDAPARERPAFYALKLPNSFLVPNQEDSCAVAAAKLTTRAQKISEQNDPADCDELVELIDCPATFGLRERTTAVLQCLTVCVNSLLLNSTSGKVGQVLSRLIFAKPASWYHSLDIVKVIRAIDPGLLSRGLGPSGFRDCLRVLLGFCLDLNDDLSKAALDVLIEKTTPETFLEVTKFVANDADLFDAFSVQKHLMILSSLITANSRKEKMHLRYLVDAVLEVFDVHAGDLLAMASIYQFLAKFDLTSASQDRLEPVVKTARSVVSPAVNILMGGKQLTLHDAELYGRYYELVKKYIGSKSAEIVSPNSHNYRITFSCVSAASVFLLSLPAEILDHRIALEAGQYLFRYFTLDCTKFLRRRFATFTPKRQRKCIRQAAACLGDVSSPRIHAIWCEIAVISNAPNPDFLIESADYFLAHPREIELVDLISFCVFENHVRGNVDIVRSALESLSDNDQLSLVVQNQLESQMTEADKTRRFRLPLSNQIKAFVRQIESKFRIVTSVRESADLFPQLVDSQKRVLIGLIVNGERVKSTPEILEFGEQILTGWKLHQFRQNLTEIAAPPVRLSSFLQPLKADRSTPISDIIARLEPANPRNPWRFAAKVAFAERFGEFASYFASASRVPKSQIFWLCEVIPALQKAADSQLVFGMFASFFGRPIKSQARLRVMLIAICVASHHFGALPPGFCEKLYQWCQKYESILPEFYAALCLREISKKFNVATARVPFIKTLAHLPPLTEALITPGEDISELLPVWRPSALCYLLRRLANMTKKPANAKAISSSLDDVIAEYGHWVHTIGIGDLMAGFIRALSSSGTGNVRGTVADRFGNDILPKTSHPAFLAVAGALPSLLRGVDKSWRVYSQLSQVSGGFVTPWTSVPVFLVYVQCLDVRLQGLPDEKTRADALVKMLTGFFEKNAKLDCYEFEKCLDGWLQLMRKYLTFEQSTDLIIRLFVRKVPRFFPAFVEVAKTAKAILHSPSEAVRAGLPKLLELAEAGLGPVGHRRAMRLLLNAESIQEALKLSVS
jgi:hypothetical protein